MSPETGVNENLLAKALGDRESRPWNYYRLEHETTRRLLNELTERLAAAESAILEYGEMHAWHSMDSAPKDGTVVLFRFATGSDPFFRTGYWAKRRETWSIDCPPPLKMPTHWTHLPSDPVSRRREDSMDTKK